MAKYGYTDLLKIGKTYYNDSSFCSVISIATACNQAYGKAYHTLKREGRRDNQGVLLPQIMNAIDKLGYKATLVDGFENKQVKSMPSLLGKTGSYMVFIRGHVLTIRDGEVCDWSDGRAHRVKRVYKIEKI